MQSEELTMLLGTSKTILHVAACVASTCSMALSIVMLPGHRKSHAI